MELLQSGDYFEYFGSIYVVTSASESSASISPIKEEGEHHKLGYTNISRASHVRILNEKEREKYIKKNKDGEPISRIKKATGTKKKSTKRDQDLKDMINLQARKRAKKRGIDLEEVQQVEAELKEAQEKVKQTKKKVARKTTGKKATKKK